MSGNHRELQGKRAFRPLPAEKENQNGQFSSPPAHQLKTGPGMAVPQNNPPQNAPFQQKPEKEGQKEGENPGIERREPIQAPPAETPPGEAPPPPFQPPFNPNGSNENNPEPFYFKQDSHDSRTNCADHGRTERVELFDRESNFPRFERKKPLSQEHFEQMRQISQPPEKEPEAGHNFAKHDMEDGLMRKHGRGDQDFIVSFPEAGEAPKEPEERRPWLLLQVAGMARGIPGYSMIGSLTGRDPISGEAVEISGPGFLSSLTSLIPSFSIPMSALEQNGIIPNLLKKAKTALESNNLSLGRLGADLLEIYNSLSWSDIWQPQTVWEKISTPVLAILKDLGNFAQTMLGTIVETVVTAVAGENAKPVLDWLKTKGEQIWTVLSNPLQFAKNLAKALGQGIMDFSANLYDNTIGGTMEYLTGGLGIAEIPFPPTWNAAGTFGYLMEVSGFSKENFRNRLDKTFGAENVEYAITQLGNLGRIFNEGPGVLLDEMQDLAGSAFNDFTAFLKTSFQESVLSAGLKKLSKIIVPGGGAIEAINGIVAGIEWFQEQAANLKEIADQVLDSFGDIIAGDIGGAASRITDALKKSVPALVGGIAKFLKLDAMIEKARQKILGWKEKATEIEEAFFAKVKGAINKILAKLRGEQKDPTASKGSNGEDTPQTKDVKQRAADFTKAKIGTEINSVEEAETALQETMSRFGPEGLKAIDFFPLEGKPLTFGIRASASRFERFFITTGFPFKSQGYTDLAVLLNTSVREIANQQEQDRLTNQSLEDSLNEGTGTTTLYATIIRPEDKNGAPKEKADIVFQSDGGLHAEDQLISSEYFKKFQAEEEQRARKEYQGEIPVAEQATLLIHLNNAPCQANVPRNIPKNEKLRETLGEKVTIGEIPKQPNCTNTLAHTIDTNIKFFQVQIYAEKGYAFGKGDSPAAREMDRNRQIFTGAYRLLFKNSDGGFSGINASNFWKQFLKLRIWESNHDINPLRKKEESQIKRNIYFEEQFQKIVTLAKQLKADGEKVDEAWKKASKQLEEDQNNKQENKSSKTKNRR